jgi:hypothetical protein
MTTSQNLSTIEAELMARYLDHLVNMGDYPRLRNQLDDLDYDHDFKVEVLLRCGLFTLQVIKDMQQKRLTN